MTPSSPPGALIEGPAPTEPRFNRRRAWTVTVMLLLFMLVNFGDKAVLGLAAKPIMHDLGLDAAQYGLLSSGFFFLFSASAVIVGFITNHTRAKWVLAVLAVVWAVTQLPFIMGMGFTALLISRIILGAAEGPANPLGMHTAQTWFPDDRRNLPCSMINLGAGLGVVLMAPAMTSVIIAFGWRWAFFTMFVIGLIWAIAWMITGREGPYESTIDEQATGTDTVPGPRIPYRRIFLCPTVLSLLICGFAAYWSLALLISWVPRYLEGPLGLSPRSAGLLIVLPWGASGIAILAQGVISDRLMRRGVTSRVARALLGAVCVLIAGAAMVLIPAAPSTPIAMIALTLAFSIGGVQFAICSTIVADLAPLRQRAGALATITALIATSGIVAPYVAGRFIEAGGGPDHATGYNHTWLIAGIMLLIGGIITVVFCRPEREISRLLAHQRGAAE